MLHVLFLILKIFGILVLSILGIILLLSIIVLFTPIRYSLSGKYDNKIEVITKAHWILYIVNFKWSYINGEIYYQFKIFGKTFLSNDEKFMKNQEEKGKKRAEKEKIKKERKEKRLQKKKLKEKKNIEECYKKEHLEVKENIKSPKLEIQKDEIENKVEKKLIDKEIKEEQRHKKKLLEFILDGFQFIINLPWLVKNKIVDSLVKLKTIFVKIWKMRKKWKQIVEFFMADDSKLALKRIINHIKLLFHYIKPKKIKGEVHFGFEDPTNTGRVLAILGMTTGIHKNKVNILPNFDNKVFEGNIFINGNVQVFFFIKLFIKVYRDKLLRKKYQEFKKRLEIE